jgi:hypothetical protein
MSDEPTRYDKYHPIYATPPMTIGKHEWRLIVYPYYTGGNVTSYQWRGDAEDYWRDQRDWPRYNFNDGMYMGLPKTLVRLHEQHRGEIEAALKGIPYPPQPQQAELFAPPLPPDPDGMNFDRASWADKAISAFQHATGTDRDAALTDLLADLMHWADRAGYGFREALDRARSHYEAETTGDGMGGKEPTRPGTDPPSAQPAGRQPLIDALRHIGKAIEEGDPEAIGQAWVGHGEPALKAAWRDKMTQAIDDAIAGRQPAAPVSDYARTLDATASRAPQRDPDRGIDR